MKKTGMSIRQLVAISVVFSTIFTVWRAALPEVYTIFAVVALAVALPVVVYFAWKKYIAQ